VDEALTRYSSNSAGQIYESVIENERKGVYLGKTVQVIPHITNEIKGRIQRLADDYDIVITEIGGTVGDIESLPFLEAVRQLRLDLGYYNTLYILLTYVPFVKSAGELKTKPSQHSAYKLREIGIQPDVLLCRSERPFAEDIYNKIALFTNVPRENVINAIDVDCVYEIPLNFQKAGLPEIIRQHFQLEQRQIVMQDWLHFLQNTKNARETVTIAVCGKYVKHQDAYKSIDEALLHAGSALLKKVEIVWIDSERNFQEEDIARELRGVQGILVPGGFGVRGIEGKIAIAKYARENNIPYLGICLGMHTAVIECARNLCHLQKANSTEFEELTPAPVIHLMKDQLYLEKIGGSMRLGAYQCNLVKDSKAFSAYQTESISERHRHRYEFNNNYREAIQNAGLKISGLSPDGLLVEIVEYPELDFFVAVQFHPEFKSRPVNPHPLFKEFVKAAAKKR